MNIIAKLCGIYLIENKINKKKYIGQSVDIKKRWSSHITKCKNSHLKAAFFKYGIENFNFSIIEFCKEYELNEKEVFYISKYKTFNNKKGYNKTTGGDSCFSKPISEETKVKISLTLKGRKLNLTEEQLKIRSTNSFGSKNVNAKTVIFYDKEYPTISALSKELNLSPSTLTAYIKGKLGCSDFILNGNLRFKGKKSSLIKIKKHRSAKSVICEGVIFETISDCAIKYNINPDTMRSWFKKERKIPNDFLKKGLKLYEEE